MPCSVWTRSVIGVLLGAVARVAHCLVARGCCSRCVRTGVGPDSDGCAPPCARFTTLVKVTNLFNQSIQQHIFGDILRRTVVGEVRFSL